MKSIAEVILSTLVEGSAVALVALGINIVFATTRIVSFAQGGIIVAAGYLAFVLTNPQKGLGMNVWLAFAIVIVVGMLIGILVQAWGVSALGGYSVTENPAWTVITVSMIALLVFWVYVPVTALQFASVVGIFAGLIISIVKPAPLGKFDPSVDIGWIITTFSIGTLFVPNVISKGVSTSTETIPDLIKGNVVSIFGRPLSWGDLIIIVVSVAIMVGLELLLSKTMLGRAFAAVQQDRITASLMGINTGRIVTLSFAIAGALGAIAAVLIAPNYSVKLENSILLSLTALVAAVFGGLGSTRGAVVGAFAATFIKFAVSTFIPGGDAFWQPLLFLVLLIVLRVKPAGLYGRVAVEKV